MSICRHACRNDKCVRIPAGFAKKTQRNVGKWEHARLQALLAAWFQSQEKNWSVKVAPEQRVQVSPSRVRIPDVMLAPRGPQPEVIVEPPVLVVEILSINDEVDWNSNEKRALPELKTALTKAFAQLASLPIQT